MKTKLLVTTLALANMAMVAHAGEHSYVDESLQRSNVVLVDLDSKEQNISIGYPGRLSNICGIKIKAASAMSAEADAFIAAVSVSPGRLFKSPNSLAEAIVAKVTDPQLYMVNVVLQTKSGQTFRQVMHDLIGQVTTAPDPVPHELIVEARFCR